MRGIFHVSVHLQQKGAIFQNAFLSKMHHMVVCIKMGKEIFIHKFIPYSCKAEISLEIGSRDVTACFKFDIDHLSSFLGSQSKSFK